MHEEIKGFLIGICFSLLIFVLLGSALIDLTIQGQQDFHCEILAKQISAQTQRVVNKSCELQFEDGIWITQAKYIKQLISEREK